MTPERIAAMHTGRDAWRSEARPAQLALIAEICSEAARDWWDRQTPEYRTAHARRAAFALWQGMSADERRAAMAHVRRGRDQRQAEMF